MIFKVQGTLMMFVAWIDDEQVNNYCLEPGPKMWLNLTCISSICFSSPES